jgi:hypothetical protein
MNMFLYCRPIACRFKLQLVTDVGQPHHHVDVFYFTPTDGTIPTNISMRSQSNQMDIYDILLTTGTNQSVIAHEVGHLLGLPHIGVSTGNEDCMLAMKNDPVNGHASQVCYIAKGTGVERDNNIMGNGSVMDARNADPWQKALLEMTGVPTNYWDISLVKQTANSTGIYGQVDRNSPLWKEYHPFEIFQDFLKVKDNWWERAM